MADYYVSKDGDDSTGDGLSWETAWKTLAAADAANTTDVVHIGPGVHAASLLWSSTNYFPSLIGYGHCVIDCGGGIGIQPIRGSYYGTVRNLQFRNATTAIAWNSVFSGAAFEDCFFDHCLPAPEIRYMNKWTRCVFNHCNEPTSLRWKVTQNYQSVPVFQRCTFINTRLYAPDGLHILEDSVFYNPDLEGDYFDDADHTVVRNNCFHSFDATRGAAGYDSIASLESGKAYASGNFVLENPLHDPASGVFRSAPQLLGRSRIGETIGALPYAHVLSPNVNSAAFAAPDHTDNVEQDNGDVWKLTSPGAGVLSWYQDLGNTYNVTGIDVIGTITDTGHVWDTDNSDSDLTYLIKGSSSPFTPVTSTPTDGVDGWQLANHGEAISLAGVRYVQVWIVPRTNGVT